MRRLVRVWGDVYGCVGVGEGVCEGVWVGVIRTF